MFKSEFLVRTPGLPSMLIPGPPPLRRHLDAVQGPPERRGLPARSPTCSSAARSGWRTPSLRGGAEGRRRHPASRRLRLPGGLRGRPAAGRVRKGERKAVSAAHADLTLARVRRVLEGTGIGRVTALSADAVNGLSTGSRPPARSAPPRPASTTSGRSSRSAAGWSPPAGWSVTRWAGWRSPTSARRTWCTTAGRSGPRRSRRSPAPRDRGRPIAA